MPDVSVWLVGSLARCLIGSLAGWLAGSLACWLAGSLSLLLCLPDLLCSLRCATLHSCPRTRGYLVVALNGSEFSSQLHGRDPGAARRLTLLRIGQIHICLEQTEGPPEVLKCCDPRERRAMTFHGELCKQVTDASATTSCRTTEPSRDLH